MFDNRSVSRLPLGRAVRAAMAVLLLTSVHHIYGAYIYRTPWRLHAVILAAVAAAAIILLAWAARRGSKLAFWGVAAIVLVVPIGLIGVFEGGYNHVLKVALYFAGADAGLMQRLFPAPAYELPNDLIFELTGVNQLVLAIVAGRRLIRAW
jgi:hypothetical protein